MPTETTTCDRPSQTYRATDRYKQGARALGSRVRCLRHDRGLSLYQAAEATGLELSYLQRLECGSINATLATLMRVADGLGVKVAELVADVG